MIVTVAAGIAHCETTLQIVAITVDSKLTTNVRRGGRQCRVVLVAEGAVD